MSLRAFLALGLLAVAACRREPVDQAALMRAHALGAMYLNEGRLDEAEAEFRKIVDQASWVSAGHANLGLVEMKRARYREAERHLRRALKRDTADADVRLLLAELYSLTDRPEAAETQLQALLARNPDDVRALYALVRFDTDTAGTARARRLERFRRIVQLEPANLAARLELAMSLVDQGDADGALAELEELERQQPVPPQETVAFFAQAMGSLRSGNLGAARSSLLRYQRFLELTPAYQVGVWAIRGPGTGLPGVPALSFPPLGPPGMGRDTAVRQVLELRDGTASAGLADLGEGGAVLALGDFTGDGVEDLIVSSGGASGAARLLRNRFGTFVDSGGAVPALPPGLSAAIVADYDNDGHVDVAAAAADGLHLFRAREDGTLREAAARDLRGAGGIAKIIAVDLDHDGDLDFVTGSPAGTRVYRNNLDGTFREISAEAGLGGGGGAMRSAALGDFDTDGLIDLAMVTEAGGLALYRNAGERRFREVAAASGLAAEQAVAVTAGDFDNDGSLDLVVASSRSGPALFRNNGDGTFARDTRSDPVFRAAASAAGAASLDYDNDGFLDIAVTGPGAAVGRQVFLFRNRGGGRFEDRSAILPEDAPGGETVFATDYDQDGDEDLLVSGARGVRLLRNDGGSLNRYVQIRLTALHAGSGKNNTLGIGARVELRAGDLYQMRVVTGRVTQFGLGSLPGADVLRITWPNGVPQTLARGFSAAVVEELILKGSCAFLYAWDGSAYRFVTDVMWKSAIGMPLDIMGAGGGGGLGARYAPPGASREYLRLPALTARDGRYTLQLTEELWETAYLDEMKLVAVDHPDSVEVYVDEKFVPPGPTPLRPYQIARARTPAAAHDGAGNDVLPLLAATDDRYVAGFRPARVQGLAEMHELLLDLGEGLARDRLVLLLQGWIFPTDASINVSMSQGGALESLRPSLEVQDARGRWRTVLPDLGFPSGKSKTVVADLRGRLSAGERRVRIRTNMQIYWDRAIVAEAVSASPVRVTRLAATAADLHYRGYSRPFRKGGRYGPHWFDYGEVSTDPPWLPIEGRFTRYGEVGSLLDRDDDMYIVMAPGDEATVHFDAGGLPELPAGWRRDFLIYTVGWIKDSDLNTARGTTVEPLPFHAMSRYPYGPEESYPTDEAHRRFVETYLTRVVARSRP